MTVDGCCPRPAKRFVPPGAVEVEDCPDDAFVRPICEGVVPKDMPPVVAGVPAANKDGLFVGGAPNIFVFGVIEVDGPKSPVVGGLVAMPAPNPPPKLGCVWGAAAIGRAMRRSQTCRTQKMGV
jgi:hypothetical protein